MEKSCGVPLQLSGKFGTVTSWYHLTIKANASGVAKNRLIRFDNSTGKQRNFRVICLGRENIISIVCFLAFSLKLDTDFQLSCGSRHTSCV